MQFVKVLESIDFAWVQAFKRALKGAFIKANLKAIKRDS